MNRNFRTTALLGFLLSCQAVAAGPGAEEEFRPDLAKVVPAVSDHVDLTLYLAGKPQDRWRRSVELRATLPDLAGLDPLQQLDPLLSWLAVCALVESAVSGEAAVPESWDLELVGLYRKLASLEEAFNRSCSAMTLVALQPGAESLPAVQISRQLAGLPAYARRGVRWLARRLLPVGAGSELRRALLEGLVEVDRREGNWKGMQQAAAALWELHRLGRFAAFEAEAWFERGEIEKAKQAFQRASQDAAPEDLDRARNREQLSNARRALGKESRGAAMARVAEAFLDLKEPWRVEQQFSEEQVVRAAHPGLDEAFIRAVMGGSLNYQAAWDFGKRARGRPPTKDFLARRIGAGLIQIMRGFSGGGNQPRLDRRLLEAVDQDLGRFRPADPQRAALTRVHLVLLRFIARPGGDQLLLKTLLEAVLRYQQAYPGDLAGVQMAFLLEQLGSQGPDTWEVAERYRQEAAGRSVSPEFLPVFAGAAILKAIRESDPKPVQAVIDWIRQGPKPKPSPTLRLWEAHLLSVRSLLSDEASLGSRLQEVVDAYGECLRLWSTVDAGLRSPEVFCDATVSVATLSMQTGSVDQARDLLDRTVSVCEAYPANQAVSTIIDLASGRAGQPGQGARERLTSVLKQIASQPAKIQIHLWLGVAAEAAGDEKLAQRELARAAAMLANERERGVTLLLAPDRRSLVAFSSNFNIGMGISHESPFGLAFEVSVLPRMFLFPPAAVDEKKLQRFAAGRRD